MSKEKKKGINLYMNEEEMARWDEICEKEGTSRYGLAKKVVLEYMEKHEKRGEKEDVGRGGSETTDTRVDTREGFYRSLAKVLGKGS